MDLQKNSQLGTYRLMEKIGEGGMGVVWKAMDTQLGRAVAIKLLPDALAADEQRLARFSREARLLASLNHPHIAAVYGLHQESGVHFLSMELVDGENLAQRLARGPLPMSEALALATEVTEGLTAAHQSGVVHRDLKPANIVLTAEGKAKILDFGLAKVAESAGEGSNPASSLSPTLTVAATAAGLIMGTAAYMSPEQARGKAVDSRADIWAFGCVLYEMLTGQRLFAGETVSDILAAVLKTDPDWSTLPAETPLRVRRLLRRVLQRDIDQRLHHIADARLELMDMEGDSLAGPGESVAAGRQGVGGWGVALVALAALVAGLLGGWFAGGQAPAPSVEPAVSYRLSMLPPEDTTFDMDTTPTPGVLSPDSRTIVFGAKDLEGQESYLYIRDLHSGETRMLPGTLDAQYPFWSPDSQWVGFFQTQSASMKKVRADGGPPVTICEAANGKGGSWSAEGNIIFAPTFGSAIHHIREEGGEPTAVTRLDNTRENSHRHPRFLADGRHFVFFARSNIPDEPGVVMLGSLDSTETRELMRANSQAEPLPGFLLLEQDQVVQAYPFDQDTLALSGAPLPLAQGVAVSSGASFAGFSPAGSHLAFNIQEDQPPALLEERDAEGELVRLLGEPDYMVALWPSPDGRRVVMVVEEENSGSLELWIQDVETGIRSRFTAEAGDQFSPVWSHDGKFIFYASNHEKGKFAIYRRYVGRVGLPELLLKGENSVYPAGTSADGRDLVYRSGASGLAGNLMRAKMDDLSAPPEELLFSETLSSLSMSPDGSLIAYVTQESGRQQVYLSDYPAARRQWRVSSTGGTEPVWAPDGRSLLFRQGLRQIMRAPITRSGDEVEIGLATAFYQLDWVPADAYGPRLALVGEGEKTLVIRKADKNSGGAISLLLNWQQGLVSAR